MYAYLSLKIKTQATVQKIHRFLGLKITFALQNSIKFKRKVLKFQSPIIFVAHIAIQNSTIENYKAFYGTVSSFCRAQILHLKMHCLSCLMHRHRHEYGEMLKFARLPSHAHPLRTFVFAKICSERIAI